MSFWQAMRRAYAMSGRFVIALPLIAALVIAVEAVQHVVEWRIGMFASTDAAEALGAHPARMGFGYVKVAILFLVSFWVLRFLGFDGDARRAVAPDRTAYRLFAIVLLFEAAMLLVQERSGVWLAELVPPGAALLFAALAAMLVAMFLELYLAAWKTGAALGNPRLTIFASARAMHGRIWWSFGFTLAMMIPLMIVHYALNGFAIGRAPALAWAMLAVDSLLVGYLAALLPAAVFVVAARAAARKGVELAPGQGPARAAVLASA